MSFMPTPEHTAIQLLHKGGHREPLRVRVYLPCAESFNEC